MIAGICFSGTLKRDDDGLPIGAVLYWLINKIMREVAFVWNAHSFHLLILSLVSFSYTECSPIQQSIAFSFFFLCFFSMLRAGKKSWLRVWFLTSIEFIFLGVISHLGAIDEADSFLFFSKWWQYWIGFMIFGPHDLPLYS